MGTSVATRVMTRASSCMVQPVPPNRSGTSSPHSPASPRAASAACENVPTGVAGASSRGAGDQADAASGFTASYSRDWPRNSAMAWPARSTTSVIAARSGSAASAAASAKPDGVMASACELPHRLAAAQLLRVVMFRSPVIRLALSSWATIGLVSACCGPHGGPGDTTAIQDGGIGSAAAASSVEKCVAIALRRSFSDSVASPWAASNGRPTSTARRTRKPRGNCRCRRASRRASHCSTRG